MDKRVAELLPFVVSLALGALVGIERERSQAEGPSSFPGGVRTFPLVALLGCAAAFLGVQLGMAVFVTIAGGFLALVVASYVVSSFKGASGTTTALASLLTFVFGVMAQQEHTLLAAALAVAMTALLSLRRPLHELTTKISQDDVYATLKLAALSVIVLPVLPDRTFALKPLDTIDPFTVGVLVVLVAAVGFLGYVGVKVLGPGRGVVAAGTLGGLASSTAATWSLAGRSREAPELSRALALGIALAWATMCVRVLVLVAFVNPSLVPLAAAPLIAGMIAGIGGGLLVYRGALWAPDQLNAAYRNPFSVWSAVKFGAIFTAILILARIAQDRCHDAGLLLAAGVSGTIEVDAMTLTLARLAGSKEIGPDLAVTGIVLACGTNTVVKAGLAFVLGAPALRRALLPTVVGTLGAGAGVLYLALRG